MNARLKRLTRAAAVLLAGSIALSGCDFDVYSLPLPGGTDVGDDPITVKADFRDVLDLVPKTTVKVNDVSIGQVTDIDLDGYTAKVTMKLRNDTKLPDNAVATIRQTSLLGEKFVSLAPPESDPSPNLLSSGDVIPLERTGDNPEVEEVLGALSLLLNGGGVAQLKTITQELNKVLEGREDVTRDVLTQIDTFVGQLDDNKGDILTAIEKLNKLSKAIRRQQPTIDSALEELPSALISIDKQRGDLVRMLKALDQLSNVGVRVIKTTKQTTIDSLQLLNPVLTELANSGDAFVDAFNGFYAYPFVDEVVGRDPQVARNLHLGDFTNLSVRLDLNVNDLISGSVLPTILNPTVILSDVLQCIQSGSLTSPECVKLLSTVSGIVRLRAECRKAGNRDTVVCKAVNLLPGLPTLPIPTGGGLPVLPTKLPTKLPSVLPSGLPSLGTGSGGGGLLPGLPGLGGLAGGLGGSGRTGEGLPLAPASAHGPTIGQLMAVFDPSLVTLLAPPMVSVPTAEDPS